MDLTKILSISGKPGLFRMIGETKTGAIVESLIDGKRFPAFASERISSLEEISIFTTGEDKPLKEIFKSIYDKESGGKSIDHKSADHELKAYFEEVLPDYDKDKVYTSDIKKVFMWYNILHEKDMLVFEEEKAGEETSEGKNEYKAETKVDEEVMKNEKEGGDEKKN